MAEIIQSALCEFFTSNSKETSVYYYSGFTGEKAESKRWHMIGLPNLIIYTLLPSLAVNARGA